MQLTLETYGLNDIQALWDQAPDIVREELAKATLEAELKLLHDLKELDEYTPEGATGVLKGSISARDPEILSNNVIGEVGTSIGHALPVELGTRPHFPPIEPLVDWVKQKMDIKEPSHAYSVAKLIQYKIGAHGTKGAMMFHRAFDANKSQINRMYESAHGQIVERLGTLH